jgi:hypothetical protein
MAVNGFQLESGASYTDIENIDAVNFGELLFRYGLTRWVELRLLLNSYVDVGDPIDEQGLEDSGIGFKVGLLQGDGEVMGKPSLTFIGGVSLETGDEHFSSEDTVYSGALSWAWQLADNLGHSAYLAVDDNDNTSVTTFATSLGFDWAGLGWSVGYGGIFPDEGEDAHFLEANTVVPLGPRNQIDFNAGFGLNSDNSGFFAGFGYAHRF